MTLKGKLNTIFIVALKHLNMKNWDELTSLRIGADK